MITIEDYQNVVKEAGKLYRVNGSDIEFLRVANVAIKFKDGEWWVVKPDESNSGHATLFKNIFLTEREAAEQAIKWTKEKYKIS